MKERVVSLIDQTVHQLRLGGRHGAKPEEKHHWSLCSVDRLGLTDYFIVNVSDLPALVYLSECPERKLNLLCEWIRNKQRQSVLTLTDI